MTNRPDNTTRLDHTTKRAALAFAGIALAAAVAVPAAAQAAGAGPDIRMDDLLHPVDIGTTLVIPGTVTSRVGVGDGPWGVSACTGEARMRDVVGPQANRYHGQFTGRVGQSGEKVTVVQHIADEPTVERTRGKYRTLVAMLTACRDEPAGHWRFGRVHHVTTPSGTAMWMLAINGDGGLSGAVIAARSGRHLGVVEVLSGCNGPQIEELASKTLHRLR